MNAALGAQGTFRFPSVDAPVRLAESKRILIDGEKLQLCSFSVHDPTIGEGKQNARSINRKLIIYRAHQSALGQKNEFHVERLNY